MKKILVLGTDYSIANDRRSITVWGQTSGDEIEVRFNRYFEVFFAGIPEEWFSGDEARRANVTLQTLSNSV